MGWNELQGPFYFFFYDITCLTSGDGYFATAGTQRFVTEAGGRRSQARLQGVQFFVCGRVARDGGGPRSVRGLVGR